jgi:hypothetical protein
MNIENGQCINPSQNVFTKSVCCCSVDNVNKGLGWGPSCEACPPINSSEYRILCPHGPGKDNSGTGIWLKSC